MSPFYYWLSRRLLLVRSSFYILSLFCFLFFLMSTVCVKKWPTGTRSLPKPTDVAVRTRVAAPVASRIITWLAFWLLKLWLSFLPSRPIIRPTWGKFFLLLLPQLLSVFAPRIDTREKSIKFSGNLQPIKPVMTGRKSSGCEIVYTRRPSSPDGSCVMFSLALRPVLSRQLYPIIYRGHLSKLNGKKGGKHSKKVLAQIEKIFKELSRRQKKREDKEFQRPVKVKSALLSRKEEKKTCLYTNRYYTRALSLSLAVGSCYCSVLRTERAASGEVRGWWGGKVFSIPVFFSKHGPAATLASSRLCTFTDVRSSVVALELFGRLTSQDTTIIYLNDSEAH